MIPARPGEGVSRYSKLDPKRATTDLRVFDLQELQSLEKEASFRLMFDNSPMPMLICDSKTLGFMTVNKAAQRLYGFSREEFLDMTIKDLAPTNDQNAQLAYVEKFRQPDASFGESTIMRQRHKSGLLIDVELSWNRIPFRSRTGILVLTHDISQRRRAEKRVHEQASLLNLASDAIIVCDLENKILFWNRGAELLYGWTTADSVGKIADTLLKGGEPGFASTMETLREIGEWSGELTHTTRNKSPITVSSRWTLVRDEAAQPKSVLIINTDITEKKKLESQFLRAQRLESIGTLASGIAHDLNNILTPISMSVGLLRQDLPESQRERLLATIEASAERGAEIVKQVITFARGVEGNRVLLQTKHLASELVRIMAQTFPKNISIQTRFPKDLWVVIGDATQLHQVFLNLCVNARDAMPDGGTLTMMAENMQLGDDATAKHPDAKPGSYVALQVNDTGCGMPAHIIEKIFDPFFTTKEPGKGTGLGLSTVAGIIKSHGGFLTVKSDPGQGTSFRIHLPAAPAAQADHEEKRKDGPPRGTGQLILVVDDEPSIREAATRTLEAHGYKAYTAEDGTDALALFFQRRDEIQLVLTDIEMDLMDGVALVSALKRVEPGVKVIASTGQGDESKRIALKQMGVKVHLDKPYTTDQLLYTVHHMLTHDPAQVDA